MHYCSLHGAMIDHRSYMHDVSSCEVKAWKKFKLEWDSNPWPLICTAKLYRWLYAREFSVFKAIPQKLKLPMIFLNFPWMFSTKHCFEKKTIKLTGHHSRLRDVMDQSYPIYACTRANHARYSSVHVAFCGSWKHSLQRKNLGKKLDR